MHVVRSVHGHWHLRHVILGRGSHVEVGGCWLHWGLGALDHILVTAAWLHRVLRLVIVAATHIVVVLVTWLEAVTLVVMTTPLLLILLHIMLGVIRLEAIIRNESTRLEIVRWLECRVVLNGRLRGKRTAHLEGCEFFNFGAHWGSVCGLEVI